MPIFMDRHFIEGATHHAIANAHEKDLKTQGKYGVKFLTYWFDEERSTAFCLVDAPDRKSIEEAHNDAHGDIPHEITDVEIKRKFLEQNRTSPDENLFVRIGVSAGEPIEDHGDLFGSAVQLAARLCAHAEPEQIVVSDLIHQHYEGEESLLDLGQVYLKGFAQPVSAFEVDYRQSR